MSRDLLANATPRPWKIDDEDCVAIYGGPENAIEDVALLNDDEHGRASAALIVAAVNEYEPLLDIAEHLRATKGQTSAQLVVDREHLLARLDAIRETT